LNVNASSSGLKYSPARHPDIENRLTTIVNAIEAHGWCVIPGFLEPELWRAIAAEARELYAQGEFRQAGVGRNKAFMVRPEIRNDRVLWVDPESPTCLQMEYLARFEQLRLRINRELSLGLFGFETHFAVYPVNCFYRRHLDQFRGATNRIVSCILYLNDAWLPDDGGELRIYLPLVDETCVPLETHVDVLPEGGTLAVFLSAGFEHEVLPARRERLSLTGWFIRQGK
jgi:SM-20-related protein